MDDRQSGGRDEPSPRGPMLEGSPPAFAAAAPKATVTPSIWSRRSATVYAVHGVARPRSSSFTPAINEAMQSAAGRRLVGIGVNSSGHGGHTGPRIGVT